MKTLKEHLIVNEGLGDELAKALVAALKLIKDEAQRIDILKGLSNDSKFELASMLRADGIKVSGHDDKALAMACESLVSEAKGIPWYGNKKLNCIYHGEWNDPEISDGKDTVNYWEIEAALFGLWREDHKNDDPERFADWMGTKEGQKEAYDMFCQMVSGE